MARGLPCLNILVLLELTEGPPQAPQKWLFLDILQNLSNYSITFSLFWHGAS